MNADGARLQVLGAVAAALAVGAAAPVPTLPAGWREPTAAEAAEWLREARRSTGAPDMKSNLTVAADFDGDGRIDRAAFLLNDSRREFALFVLRASEGRYRRLDYGGALAELSSYGLDTEPPGVYTPFPADDAELERPRQVRTRWTAIGAEFFEASYVIFFWDGRRFRAEWLSD